jgi:hypothetical protein
VKKRFLLRLDPAIYEALEKWAADDLRSVNGQIEYLLLDALRRSGRRPARSASKQRDREQESDSPGED